MKTLNCQQLVIVLGLLMTCPHLAAVAQEDPPPADATPAGSWRGNWFNRSGYTYDAVVRIRIAEDGTLDGQIDWTLRVTPREGEMPGSTAVENIRGTYDSKTRIVAFKGFSKDDPKSVIGLDNYRLLFAENGKVMGGITENHGTWQGVFSLIRVGEAK